MIINRLQAERESRCFAESSAETGDAGPAGIALWTDRISIPLNVQQQSHKRVFYLKELMSSAMFRTVTTTPMDHKRILPAFELAYFPITFFDDVR